MTVRSVIPDPILEHRIVPIARRLSTQDAVALGEVLLAVGVPLIEVTMEGEDAEESIGRLASMGLLVGAGTVFSQATADAALAAGASFIVCPHTAPDIIGHVHDRKVPVFPGAVTPTEIRTAWTLGATAVKLFPAAIGGPSLLSTLRGPFADVAFIPTGGIDAGNAGDYLDAGAVAVGVGSWLTGGSPQQVAERAGLLRQVTNR